MRGTLGGIPGRVLGDVSGGIPSDILAKSSTVTLAESLAVIPENLQDEFVV